MSSLTNQLLKNQITYYKARAHEYDDWFQRLGRWDKGPKLNALWFSEVKFLEKTLAKFNPQGSILEFAAGTGWWTEKLVKFADHITAVDSSAETLDINKVKVGSKKVTFIKADVFSFKPDKLYDLVFFSFWLSHVPPDKFNSFWQLVSKSLKKKGQVFFIDSAKHETPKPKSNSQKPEDITSLRSLKSGKEFTIIKIFYQPEKLSQKLHNLGWHIQIKSTPNFFLYGFGRKLN